MAGGTRVCWRPSRACVLQETGWLARSYGCKSDTGSHPSGMTAWHHPCQQLMCRWLRSTNRHHQTGCHSFQHMQEFFPHIFGPEEDQALDAEAARAALADLAREVNAALPSGQPEKSVDEARSSYVTHDNKFVVVAAVRQCGPRRLLTPGLHRWPWALCM